MSPFFDIFNKNVNINNKMQSFQPHQFRTQKSENILEGSIKINNNFLNKEDFKKTI